METARGIQMTVLDRLILALVGLFLVLLGLSAAASAFGWAGFGSVKVLLDDLDAGVWEAAVVGLIFLLAGLHVLFFALQQEKDEGIRQETEMGHVRISLRAIENLVHRTAKSVKGIKDVDVHVFPSPEGVAVVLSLVVHPELPVPQISQEVGHLVRTRVRETVGVSVGDISIDIRNIAGETKPVRVE